MSSVRTVIWVSVFLAVVTFVGMMVVAPVGAPDRPRPRETPMTVADQAARIRRSLASDRRAAAESLAAETVEMFPGDPEAWLWQVQVFHVLGDQDRAREAARRLADLLAHQQPPTGALARAQRAYFEGWAAWVLSRADEARERFAMAADLYEGGSAGVVGEAFRQYNLAGFRAMAGQAERAAEHFALAVDAGYAGDAGWWLADPDLASIREVQAFRDAAVVLHNRELERLRELRERWEAARAGQNRPNPPPGDPGGVGEGGGGGAETSGREPGG